jgi:hypothetical protein
MTNLEACRAKCKLICNTCYVDKDVLEVALMDSGIDPNGFAVEKDKELMRTAIIIVKGWVETSRSEGGISTSIDMASVRNSISFWCGEYGLDASEFLSSLSTIENGSYLW